ncbi:uncharacterized protein LOC130562678 [Triplophysa rosa]|uniref:U2A'/phosphoprotein 32 family A C-terminal domain-containing protein n=1 Tax=Triplophysa rosa TaxID=992332 RepID=A0A9W7WI31_TRIRA|nr:uncharacterized protein LOC130562678 [Triplophysa rosa]KAI7802547.1 hypothetical protein IRJ41_013093 [Triplophysa rosa]
MSESSSGVITSSESFPKSQSHFSELSDTHTPLSVELTPDSGIVATPLPSSRFRFASWHCLEEHDVRGDQLACPRVREGPAEGELSVNSEDISLRGGRRKRREEGRQKWEERLQENWENCVVLNLSYQDLGDPYQLENFTRILKRLIRVEHLQLVDNSLKDLSSVRLPRCKILNLHRNHLTSVRQLPKVPDIQHLCLSENSISSLSELCLLRNTPLRSLTLKRNPCQFLERYRSRVFACLPNLQVLDGIPKLPEDCVPPPSPAASRLCIIL